MKKYISLLLAFLMCLALCACGTDPLAEEYATVDEVVNALASHYTDPKEQHKTVQANSSIYKYFQRDHIDDEIWKKLKDITDKDGNSVFSMSEIHNLYNICNQTNGFDDWFEFINVGSDGVDKPFIMYGDSGMTVDELTESIKRKFKDPDSVSINNAWVCFALPNGAVDAEDFKLYEDGCRYVILAEVRAKNGFGAYDSSICKIEGSVGWSSWTFSVKETDLSMSLLTRPSVQMDGYGAWSRIF